MLFTLMAMAAAQIAERPVQEKAPPPVRGPDVVVEGRSEADRRREADIFVRRVAPVAHVGQMPRWKHPVCAGVTGLSDALNARVADRVRVIARSVGAPVAEQGCAGNALIAFTSNARAVLREVERVRPHQIAGVRVADRQALHDSQAPVLWWTTSIVEGMDGEVLGRTDFDKPLSMRQPRNSLISRLSRATYIGASVLVDAERSTGVRLDAVADYAAFVILSGARFGAPAGRTTSILDLFATPPDQRPATLTEADRAYLTGLYAMRPDRTARTQVRAITSGIVRDVGKVDASAD